jgi:hypothetical protein
LVPRRAQPARIERYLRSIQRADRRIRGTATQLGLGRPTAARLDRAGAGDVSGADAFDEPSKSNPDAALPTGFAGERLEYEASQIILRILIVLVGSLFYYLGAPPMRRRATSYNTSTTSQTGRFKLSPRGQCGLSLSFRREDPGRPSR